jgi:hypothetical protein
MTQKKTLLVSASTPGAPCPMYPRKVRLFRTESGEMRDRSMIYHDEVVEVPNIRFYRRRIVKRDLVQSKAMKATPLRPKAKAVPKPPTTRTTKSEE